MVYIEPMTQTIDDQLDMVFHALANRTRRQLLADLAERPARVNELGRPYGMSVAAISKHLFVLEHAGLITRRKEGSVQLCLANPVAMRKADEWLAAYRSYWKAQLDSFADFVESESQTDGRDN